MLRIIFAVAVLGATFLAHSQGSTPFSTLTDEAPLRKILTDYSDLKDPFSAHFRRTEVQTLDAGTSEPSIVWCGQINAKNSNGGFTGWVDFSVVKNGKNVLIAIEDGSAAVISKVQVDTFCKEAAIRTNP